MNPSPPVRVYLSDEDVSLLRRSAALYPSLTRIASSVVKSGRDWVVYAWSLEELEALDSVIGGVA